ncbi:hypothetical protein AcV5_010471 [Taiwanofungus camphoratus]|nr:hypothetical protein AcV5_010471 [Antrodia cinnamomea]
MSSILQKSRRHSPRSPEDVAKTYYGSRKAELNVWSPLVMGIVRKVRVEAQVSQVPPSRAFGHRDFTQSNASSVNIPQDGRLFAPFLYIQCFRRVLLTQENPQGFLPAVISEFPSL